MLNQLEEITQLLRQYQQIFRTRLLALKIPNDSSFLETTLNLTEHYFYEFIIISKWSNRNPSKIKSILTCKTQKTKKHGNYGRKIITNSYELRSKHTLNKFQANKMIYLVRKFHNFQKRNRQGKRTRIQIHRTENLRV